VLALLAGEVCVGGYCRPVGRIDLGERELTGIGPQPLLRRHRPLRIQVGLLDKRLVGLGAAAVSTSWPPIRTLAPI
jgi:hypothetical protein